MTKEEFRKFVEEHTVVLDGATGSNLMKAGMPRGVCTEAWVLEHPETLISLQKAYVEAGSNIIYAPTFTGNRIKLSEYDLYDRMEEMMTKLVQLSKEAVGDKALIAGDVTMTGRQLEPMGDLKFEELVDIYKEQIGYLAKAGVDLLVVETMLSLQECRAALIAAKEVCDLPVMVTLTFEMDGKTLYGTDARTAAIVLDHLGADAIGANCSTGPVEMAGVLKMMGEVTRKPIIGKPNAGLPKVDGEGQTYYDMDADAFYEGMKHIIDAGASIIGGCCGTNPSYIRKIASLQKKNVSFYQEKRYLTSERKTLAFGLDDPFMVVGERINPTGKKALQASLKEGSMDMVIDFAEQQEAAGASILDVNMGMSGVDEKELMVKAVEELSVVTSLPLSLDSSMPEVLDAALRIYPGRALVNSVSLEEVKIKKILPLVKKYGAMFILLPVSDEGLPKDAEEKNRNIEKILEYAYELGLTNEDIVVDGLVATVGAEKEAAIRCLDTIRHCKESELATICGLSNISFGLPERPYVNSAFLTMAIADGLTMAIMNPNQEIMLCAAYASDLLLAKEESDIRYIEFASALAEKHKKEAEEAEKNRLLASQNGVILDVSGKK
ncbi:MAG: homocysteine S-methyltransferase family protein [Lachnospiraceae bacterium]|nr:homocysteine S-methyltransferase family protein [Lachnospiraceae bacterium]